MEASSLSSAALLIAGDTTGSSASDASLLQTLGQLGEALLATGSRWRVTRLAPGDRAGPRLDHGALERELASLSELAVEVALVVVVGGVRVIDGEPVFVVDSAPERGGASESLHLSAIASRLRAFHAARTVVVLGGWTDGAPSTDEVDRLGRAWLAELTTGRSGDLIAVGAGPRAAPAIQALRDAFEGEAVDRETGTVTIRSLGAHLATAVPGLALAAPTLAETVAASPPLTSRWDPRLTRRQRRPGPPAGPAHAAPDALVGAVLPGRLRIDGFLAKGGFGTVYRGRQLAIERDVAVKIMNAEVDPGSRSGRLFVHEIQSVGRIDHPNVVRIFHADVTPDGRLFFAMELLQGRDLEQLIQAEGRLGEERALALIEQLLAGLGAAHEAGLIHADIKPANALIAPGRTGERVVLLDFGLSRLRAQDHPTRSVGGTPAYMAPEQLRSGRIDARSDLFAAALVLVTLLTGWRRTSRDALVPPLDDIADPRLREALRRALAQDPAERFATAGELADALTGRARTRPSASRRALASLPALVEVMSDRLYGRDREVEALSEAVLFHRAAVLAGRAGVGKTTLLRRGLIPRLEGLGAHVAYAACRAGARDAAVSALARGIDPAASEVGDAISRWHARGAGKLVIVLDQLEALLAEGPPGLEALVHDLLEPESWPPGAEISLIACVRTPGATALRVRRIDAAVVTLGLLTAAEAREAIVGPLAELRLSIDDDLLAVLLRDLEQAAARELPGELPRGIYPPHLRRACAALYEALLPEEARLTHAHYERSGGAAIIEAPAAPAATAGSRIWAVGAAALLALGGVAAALALLAPSSPPPPPEVIVGGSGTILYGFLEPVLPFLEAQSATRIPISSVRDLGTAGGMRSLQHGELDVAALSGRFEQKLPAQLLADGKLLVEIPIGFDETALFVRRENPMRRLELAAIRAHLCCGGDEGQRPVTWAELGLGEAPLSSRAILWTAFGRTAPPRPNDTSSSTLLQADVWLCSPRQLCPSERAADIAANEVLALRADHPDVLALSSRSFATDQVVPLAVIDSARGTRLDGRKALWLYVAVPRQAALPARVCRFLDAVLHPSLAGRLAALGKAQGLPEALLQRQRAALGLHDGSCDDRPIRERADPQALAEHIVRSPIASELEITERWIRAPP